MSKVILKKNENGEIEEISLSKFLAQFEREHEVPALEHEEAGMASDVVTEQLYQLASAGKDLPDVVSEYSKYYELMKDAVKESKSLEKEQKEAEQAKKDEAAAAKEKAKKDKEEAAAKLESRRNLFLESATEGFEDSADKFREDLTSMKDSLPTGISVVVNDDSSFGLVIDDNVSDEDLSRSLGSMIGGQEANEFMRNAYQFFIGELANAMVKRGIYDSMIQCGKALSEKLKTLGMRLAPRNIEGYARMAQRIPVELRNAKADPSAYLEVSNIPYPKPPKREEKESKGDFEARQAEWVAEKQRVDKHRLQLAEMLKNGEVVTKDADGNEVRASMVTRREILPVIKEVKIKLGLAEREDENKKSVADWARQLAEATLALENLMGIHEKDVVMGLPADDAHAPRKYTKADLNALIEEAKNNLLNMLWPNLQELTDGQKEIEVTVYTTDEKTGKKVAKKDRDGNVEKTTKIEKVYPKFIAIGS